MYCRKDRKTEFGDIAQCSVCGGCYDVSFAGITETGYQKLGDRNTWKCNSCENSSSLNSHELGTKTSAVSSITRTTKLPRYANDAAALFLGELTSRIVAESGIPGDRFHMGKIILQSIKDAPDFIMQIDGATKEKETNRSVMQRTVQCATAMKRAGVKKGDIIVIIAPSHLHLAIPFYAAFYIGAVVATVDKTLGTLDLLDSFNVNRPRMVFCQSQKAPNVEQALKTLELDTMIVTFDKDDNHCNLNEFLATGNGVNVDTFRPDNFDPEDTLAMLIMTSGTTGLPKSAAVTHKNLAIAAPCLWARFYNFPTPTPLALVISPNQWLSAIVNFLLSPIFRYTRLQTSLDPSQENVAPLLDMYKPTFTIVSPALFLTLTKPNDRFKCDFSCLDLMIFGGATVPQSLVDEAKKMFPTVEMKNVYGISELATIGFHNDNTPPGACGKPIGCFQYRLVNPETHEDIFEPNVSGELWMKGPSIFKEYYNNPKSTAESFSDDRWYKTGDIFYRDDQWNFYFVERMKLLLKYRSYQVSPSELENVISQHPGVLNVAVTGVPDRVCEDLPAAVVVLRPGYEVTAEEIKNLVKESLSDVKQLRGGVYFLPELPLTPSGKVNRTQLKKIAIAKYEESLKSDIC